MNQDSKQIDHFDSANPNLEKESSENQSLSTQDFQILTSFFELLLKWDREEGGEIQP